METEEKDYQRAAREIRERFAGLGIKAEFSAPAAEVEYRKPTPSDPDQKPWPHIAFRVTFSRAGQSISATFSTTYRCGTGCAPWKSPKVRAAVGHRYSGKFSHSAAQYVAERECYGKGGKRYLPEIEAEAALIACQVAKWTPDPAEILAQHCRDGRDARDVTFEDWAPEYGYDADSRAAETVFQACRNAWADVRRILSAEEAEWFAEKAAEL